MPEILAAIQDLDPEGQITLVVLPVLQSDLGARFDDLGRTAAHQIGVVGGVENDRRGARFAAQKQTDNECQERAPQQ